MKKNNYQNYILLFLIFFWVGFAIFSVFYNSQKAISEVREWGPLTDGQKRQKIFGNIYNFFLFIEQHTDENAQVLVFSTDIQTSYLSKYYLYPRIINSTDDKEQFLQIAKNSTYPYLAIYGSTIDLDSYKLIASSNDSQQFTLYKRK